MTQSTWSDSDTDRALVFWDEYLRNHDVSEREGQTAGIDPETGEIWFGESGLDIVRQMEQRMGHRKPFYAVRVGKDYYIRRGGRG